MKSAMLNRHRKVATVLVSRQTLEQAVSEGQALAEQYLQTNPHDPQLDQLEQAVARLLSVLHSEDIDSQLDDTGVPGAAQAIKKDVDMIAQARSGARPERVVDAAAGGGADAWVSDRGDNGEPKIPQQVEVPRLAAKKKEAEPAIPAVAPPAAAAPVKGTGSPLDYVPTEMILKIVQDLPKQEGFEQNKGMQSALVEMTQLLQSRPVVAPKPEAGAVPAAAPAPQPVAASAKKAAEEGQRHDDVPVAPTPNVFTGDTKAEDSKTAHGCGSKCDKCGEIHGGSHECKKTASAAPAGWESVVKEMKRASIEDPIILANSMKDKGYTPHKASFILRKRGSTYLVEKFARNDEFADDGKKGDVIESGGRTPEVEQAHKLKDEAPAKLDRPATTDPMKLASAKDAEALGEKLAGLYKQAADLLKENSSREVRAFVDAVASAHHLADGAIKVLAKQEMQEKAEEEATKVKKKQGSLFGGLKLASEEEDEEPLNDACERLNK